MANKLHIPRKLTADAVVDIKTNYKPRVRGSSVPDFAKKYAVSAQTITSILKGRTWAHVVVAPAAQAPATSPSAPTAG